MNDIYEVDFGGDEAEASPPLTPRVSETSSLADHLHASRASEDDDEDSSSSSSLSSSASSSDTEPEDEGKNTSDGSAAGAPSRYEEAMEERELRLRLNAFKDDIGKERLLSYLQGNIPFGQAFGQPMSAVEEEHDFSVARRRSLGKARRKSWRKKRQGFRVNNLNDAILALQMRMHASSRV